jgi:hypothetical protein
LNPKPHEAQLEDQKGKKSSRKTARPTKTRKAANQAKWKRRAKKSSKPK